MKTVAPAFDVARFSTHANATEDESKFLVSPTHSQNVGEQISRYFFGDLGCDGYTVPTRRILTRQLDDSLQTLRQIGLTARNRCDYKANGTIVRPDTCIKVEPPQENPQLMFRRGEYEAPIRNFEDIDFGSLKIKYPKPEHAELHDIVDYIGQLGLKDQFHIIVDRTQYIIGIPHYYLSDANQKDKYASIELQEDHVKFALITPRSNNIIVFGEDTEIEYELAHGCEYDNHPAKEKYLSRGLNEQDKQSIFAFVNDHIQNHATLSGALTPNRFSKAARGYKHKDGLEEYIRCRASHQDFSDASLQDMLASFDNMKRDLVFLNRAEGGIVLTAP